MIEAPRRLAAPRIESTLDRAARWRTDRERLAQQWPQAQVVVIEDGQALVRGDQLVLVAARDAPPGERLFLGIDSRGTPYFAVAAALPAVSEGDPARPRGVREAGHLLRELDAELLMTAAALANWHARHQYSSISGRPTSITDGGWMRTDDAGESIWPRTDPAVIALVHDGVPGEDGRCLLARNTSWVQSPPDAPPRYSCLAGFVEPGESAEQAVVREVAEEVGIGVDRLHYLASQPWPYPGSLMLGFHAVASPDQPLRPDPAEIGHAAWFTRHEVRAAAIRDPQAQFWVSNPSSIAYYLIVSWLTEDTVPRAALAVPSSVD